MAHASFHRILALGAALALCRAPARAQSGRLWRPGERVVVTRLSDIGALTRDDRRVYAASPGGIGIYDFVDAAWDAPVTAVDGFPAGEHPTALAYERFGDRVWMATAEGGLYTYTTAFGRWDRKATIPAAPVLALVFDTTGLGGTLFLYTRAGWFALPSGSFIADPVPPARVPGGVQARARDILSGYADTDPALSAALGTIGVDEHMRRWSLTAVTPAEEPGRYWAGTAGGGLFAFDSRTLESRRLPYGLESVGASALAADGGGIWFGGDGRGPEAGVAWADTALGTWRQWDARYDGAPAGAVHAVLPLQDAVWFAAGDGLYRLDRGRGGFHRIPDAGPLPLDRVGALAPAGGGAVWVGTREGLALVGPDGETRGVSLRGAAVNRLRLAGDTLWIATDAGLWMLPDAPARAAAWPAGAHAADSAGTAPRDSVASGGARAGTGIAAERGPGTEDAVPLRGRILDAVPAAGALWALGPDGLYRHDAAGWQPVAAAAVGRLGRGLALAAADGQLWVAEAGGLARWDAALRTWTTYAVGPDLPVGPVVAVLPAGDDVWAATPGGAVRLRWRH